ncbi:hypothetical protein ACFORH_30785 [Amycolatopsis roodepoortensis]|uniref:DUF2178 domain-containing protein n=1 Tax=Amycolatopsis roodepoortensis TaxID=700274 RepID=A0ABR9KXI5_9PSEU|nr:hypothetical protein [Amycolatopsis roodepoortensis]MBE1573084.1 hypothetical protein [Amycolatopsis roodepoortensis]
MAMEEKRAWIMVVVTVFGYAAYLIVVLRRAGSGPLVDIPYVAPLLWTIGAAIVASIVLNIAAAITSPRDAGRKDQRDREIGRFGEYLGQSFVVIGSVAALVMAMAELDHFWIANTVYLAFVLSSLLGSIAKIAAYRWGFQAW